MVSSSLPMGCPPLAKSMIDKRRLTRPKPDSAQYPTASGPRCAIASPIARRMAGWAGRSRSAYRTPAIPHIAEAYFQSESLAQGSEIPAGLEVDPLSRPNDHEGRLFHGTAFFCDRQSPFVA